MTVNKALKPYMRTLMNLWPPFLGAGIRVKRLQPDWKEIDAAFAGHTDPLLGPAAGAEYEMLFRRIVNLAPPPVGVGPEVLRNR